MKVLELVIDKPRARAILALAILSLTLPWWHQSHANPSTEAFAIARPSHRSVTLTGFTRARAQAPMVAETSGRVLEVGYDIGDIVDQNTPFARLDETFIRLDLDEIEVQMERLGAQIDYDRREVERYKELARQNNASASQLDTLEQALRNNGHERRALGVRARVLEERLARTTVDAPVGWRIIARSVEPGQWVHEGETIGRAADFSTLIVPFALTSGQFAAIQSQSDPLQLMLTDQGLTVPARVYRINPGFDPETRKIALDLALDSPIEPSRGGLRVELTLRLPERTGALSLPESAVERSYDEYFVTRENGQRLRVLLLGTDQSDPTRVRVTSPELHPGDRLRIQTSPESQTPDSLDIPGS